MRRAKRVPAGAIACPHARRQAIFRIVGQANRLIVAVERHHRQHRAEGFLAHDAHLVSDIRQYGRRIIVLPDFRQAFSSRQHARSLGPGVFHLRFHIPQLALMDQRANLNLGIHAVTHSQSPRQAHAGLEKWPVQAAMHVATLDRKTGLPGVDECAPNRTPRGDFDVGIVEHQHGVLAAQLQHHRQQASRRGLGDLLSQWERFR